MKNPYTTCTSGEYVYLRSVAPSMVEKLGPALIETDEHDRIALPVRFIFFGSARQMQYWQRSHDIDPRNLFLAIDGRSRLQGLMGRPWPIYFDDMWVPQGTDERVMVDYTNHTVRDMESRSGSLWDVVRFLHPEDEKKWIRLA